jgi:hypothetical protein
LFPILQVSLLQKQKVDIENALEQEEEALSNRLQRRLSEQEHEILELRREVERLHGRPITPRSSLSGSASTGPLTPRGSISAGIAAAVPASPRKTASTPTATTPASTQQQQ